MGTSVGVSNLPVVTLPKENDTLPPPCCHQLLVVPPMGVELVGGRGTGILTGLIIPEDMAPHVLTGASLLTEP